MMLPALTSVKCGIWGAPVNDISGSFSVDDYPFKRYFTPDPSHMFKNVRNALCHLGCFVDENDIPIKWRYFELLNKIQYEEGLKFGNKISHTHLQFKRNKLKVRNF